LAVTLVEHRVLMMLEIGDLGSGSVIPFRSPGFITASLREDRTQLHFPSLGRSVRLLALAPGQFVGDHRHPGPIDLDVHDRNRLGVCALTQGQLGRNVWPGKVDEPLNSPSLNLNAGLLEKLHQGLLEP
jgi:hypothetical protein